VTKSKCLSLCGLAGLAVLITGPGAFAQASSDWDKTIAAAKAEGQLVFYNATPAKMAEKLVAAFEKKYGIKVDTVNARSSEIRERIRADRNSGRSVGDVMINGIGTSFTLMQEGSFEQHGHLPALANMKAPFTTDGTLLPYRAGIFVLGVNTSLVEAADEPKSWFDILDPKWKGKILMDDPRASAGGYQFFDVTYQKFGEDYLRKVADQKPTIGRETATDLRRLAQGEFPLYFPVAASDLPGIVGLPVKPIVPSEGAPYVVVVNAVLKQPPHPNAARLFLNFMLEEDAQRIASEFGSISVTGIKADNLSPMIREMSNAKLLGQNIPEKQAEMLKLANEIFK